MKKILTVLITLLTSLSVLAETEATIEATKEPAEEIRQYDIELIIFEDAHARYINNESWPGPESGKRMSSDSEEAEVNLFVDVTNAGNKQTVTDIKPVHLTRQYNSLKRSSEFNVLFHSAWRQRGLSDQEAFDIDIETLKNRHNSRSVNSIEGTIKVVLARYLHFYTELDYRREPAREEIITTATEDNSALNNGTGLQKNLASSEEDTMGTTSEVNRSEVNRYAVKSHRKMRSKELHYIDHPLVGILVRIDPVEITVEPEKTDEQTTGKLSPLSQASR